MNRGMKQQSLIWVLGVFVNLPLHTRISTDFAGVGLGAAKRFIPPQIIPLQEQDLGDGGAQMWRCTAWDFLGGGVVGGGMDAVLAQPGHGRVLGRSAVLPAPAAGAGQEAGGCLAAGPVPRSWFSSPGSSPGILRALGQRGAPAGWGSPMWTSIPEHSPKEGQAAGSTPWDGCAAQPQRARKAAQCHQGAGSRGCWRGARWHGCYSPGKANWRAVEPLPTLPAARLFSKLFPWPRLTPALGLSRSLLSSFSPAERQSYGRAVLQGTHPCFRGPLRDPRSHNPALDTIGASISSSFPSWFNDTYSHCSCTRSLQ